ncbi:Uu.00g012740.m01.CDS01 [Anthostomella pinea]|uniref:Uu.00g012740.m01.CDS01 n=1 Tax=Anthostomella pinea TaxID=933095 RepID=A0AAI8VYX4_9PEZI|nr:Uu.00g012740.m01.CDS01 [Anthostomella pinea]
MLDDFEDESEDESAFFFWQRQTKDMLHDKAEDEFVDEAAFFWQFQQVEDEIMRQHHRS